MQKRHYELVAKAIAEAMYELAPEPNVAYGVELTANKLADALARQNEKFDRARFLRACDCVDLKR